MSFLFLTPTALPLRQSHRRCTSPRRPTNLPFAPRALLDPHSEHPNDGLDDTEPDMDVWNTVIHASLKRKLEGLKAETPFQTGVSALMHAAPGYTSSTPIPDGAAGPPMPPGEVVSHLLKSFVDDALIGAGTFIRVASDSNHVKRATPQSLVLFVGDNESYRILLRLTRFSVERPRFEDSGRNCVVRATVYDGLEEASFDFQLSEWDGQWLVDECFRI